MRVLVADHDLMWQEFLCTRLQASGLEPVRVVNGERAWEVLQERDAPRLAIVDRRLPRLDAIEICRRLRARGDPFYIYMMLLLPNPHLLEKLPALEAGADDCLAKPFSQEEFEARLAIARRVLDVDARLTKLNSRWKAMLDSLPFGVAAVDNKGIVKRVNAKFALQMGYDDIRLVIGQSLSQMLQQRIDVKGLLEQVRWTEPFDDVQVQCRACHGKVHSVRLWGRPLVRNEEAIYEIVVLESA